MAKNVVAAGLAGRCEVQLAYAIGGVEPVSIMVDTFGTGTADEGKIEAALREVFPAKPANIVAELQLRVLSSVRLLPMGTLGVTKMDSFGSVPTRCRHSRTSVSN